MIDDNEHHGGTADCTPGFDELTGEVLPGSSVVARTPGIVLVLRRRSPELGGSTVDADRAVAELLELVRAASRRGAPAPGRDLARVLNEFVVRARAVPDFGTVAATHDGIALFLRGDVSVSELAGDDQAGRTTGGPLQLSGKTAAFQVDRLLPRPVGPLILAVGPAPDRLRSTSVAAGWSGLVEGLVPGDGIVLSRPVVAAEPVGRHRVAPAGKPSPAQPLLQVPRAAAAFEPMEEQPAADRPASPPSVQPAATPPATPPVESPAAAAAPLPAPPSPPDAPGPVLRPPKISDRISRSKVLEARRPPLPAAGARPPGPRPGVPAVPAHVVVKGFRCSNNHHNDPRVSFCSVCGIRMDQRTGVLVDGRRPPLGLLVLDIGATFVLDDNYLLGRNPEVDEAVVRGQLRPIRLDDDSGTLSRAHAEIRLEGWDVLLIDRGSANGSFIAAAGQHGWTRLKPHQPVVLAAGTHVRIGRRMFTFESAQARI